MEFHRFGRCNLKKTNKPNIASRESCFKAGGGFIQKMILLPEGKPLDVLRRNKACPLLLAIGVLQRSPYLARFGWQSACWGSVCVAKVILLAETKTTRQGDGCEELAIHGWFPPFWAIFGCKKSQPVDGRHQKEIRMEASWTIVWTCDLLYINWLAHFVHQHYVLTVGGGAR